MKTKLTWFLATLVLAPFGGAAEQTKPACCSTETPACCAAATPAATAATTPLSARSLYQLDAMWTNDAGAPVALRSWRGQPVVIAMFFASCEYACPLLVTDMMRLRDALPAETRAKTRFVLVTFDTARDTPAALKAYRERMNLDAGWTLLRGEPASVQDLAMLLGVKYKQDAGGQFSHSNLITVLNTEGEIKFQRSGLQGDVLEPARAVTVAAK
jgi:protein SCO1/2